MSWRSQLEQLCGAQNVGDLATGSADGAGTLPWVDVEQEEQLCELLALARASARRVLPAGAGEHLPAARLSAADVVVSLRRRNRIVDYQPADLTLVAQGGVTLRQLDEAVAAENQVLAVDCARGNEATLGGAVASNRHGLDRLRHGTWRDHVLGARVMHADGSITRTGSRVVKSVSGYDLAKLYVGSYGSTVFLLDINLRVLCAFESTGTLRASLPSASAADALRALNADRGLQPSAILLVVQPQEKRRLDELDVVVRFQGRSAVVAAQLQKSQQSLGGQVLDEDAARQLADQLRQQCEPAVDRHVMRVSSLPVEILKKASDWLPKLDAQSGLVAHYGVGIMHLMLSADVWDHSSEESKAVSAPLSKLQRALRTSFDPANVLLGGDDIDNTVT